MKWKKTFLPVLGDKQELGLPVTCFQREARLSRKIYFLIIYIYVLYYM